MLRFNLSGMADFHFTLINVIYLVFGRLDSGGEVSRNFKFFASGWERDCGCSCAGEVNRNVF